MNWYSLVYNIIYRKSDNQIGSRLEIAKLTVDIDIESLVILLDFDSDGFELSHRFLESVGFPLVNNCAYFKPNTT